MNSGRFVLSQVLDQVHRQALERCAQRYNANDRVRHFGGRQQFTAMAFAQMTWREGLRDIEACLNAKPEALYHLGFSGPIARSTLADANEGRDWRLWGGIWLSDSLPRPGDSTLTKSSVCSWPTRSTRSTETTIDLSLSLFSWADFRSTKAGVKLHTQLEICGDRFRP